MSPARRGPVDGPAPGYDAELRLYNTTLREATAVRAHERVLDVGCGAGQTTREAARAASQGSALGVDVSAPAVERARALARAEGLSNVAFEHGDAQEHPFPRGHFDVAVSRFGTMFFADATAAFTNIRRALRPSGRLVLMVWQPPERNAWERALRDALATPALSGPDPFSLADPPATHGILTAAGFSGISFTDVRHPVYYGPDVPAALDWIRTFTCTRRALDPLDPPAAARVLDRLRTALTAHLRADGVWFDSRAWLVTATPAPEA